jgi:pyruvate dehydrogenase E1 component alpha subunit
MMMIRRFEEESARNYAKGKIGGFLHLYIGQEAIAVAAAEVLEDRDYIFQTYRDHGIALARGMSAKSAMAELFGKDTGCSRGLGGSMHFFDVERGFLGGWGIVGGHLALAAGTAFKSKYSGEDSVTVCFFGDGSTNIGGFHEAMSLAGLWKLPVVFVCENNQYAMGTPLERTSPLKDLSVKAKGYGMVGDRFDGHDVEVVQERMSDPAKYRSRTELEQRKAQDPVVLVRDRLLGLGVDENALDDIDLEVDEEIDAAVRFAEDSEPALEEVMMSTVLAPEGDS